MNALQACILFTAKRPTLPDFLAPFLALDMTTPITVRCLDGEGEVVVDLWPHTMAAVLEADGRLDDCNDEHDLAAALTGCLLSDWADRSSSELIGRRSHDLAVQMLNLGIKLKQAQEKTDGSNGQAASER
ncbi:MAG TPA: hypothetical protein VFI31_04960 [Pirellulales bacterium]|nr:hypothetical protein [Pirellulales bacterium]